MKKSKLFMLLGAALIMTACVGPESSSSSLNTSKPSDTTSGTYQQTPCPDFLGYDSLSAEARKDTYSTYLSYMPATLNYTKTMQSENAQHIANFVDGLVEHDRFGNLVPCLAETTGEHNDDYTRWTFKVKDGIKWVTADGNVYKYESGEKLGQEALVKAEDFRTTLKVVLNAATISDSAYLPMLIIKGAEQFFYATSAYQQAAGNLTESAKRNYVWNQLSAAGLTEGCTSSDVEAILNFEKVGIEVDEANNSITYVLSQASDYFPTMLTYLPFLPLDATFYNKHGAEGFGAQRNILFCGAYVLKERNEMRLTYEKNPYYWDVDSVKTPKIEYKKLSENVPDDFARNEFEAGNIDGFSLSSRDTEGWEEYVKGEDGMGTIIEPHNDLTYSQEGQGDKSSFFFMMNLSRKTKNSTSLTSVTEKEIANVNKAIQYSYFRNAVYNALDLEAYNARNGFEELEQTQYQINTYTPKYFVTDNEGKDYFEYLVDAYQKKHNVSHEEAENALKPGKVNQISLEQSVKDVKDAISKLEKDDASITYPIKIEYTSLYGDRTEQYYDDLFIEYTNERLNGCIINSDYAAPNSPLKVCKSSDVKVQVVPNEKIASSNNYITVSNNKEYTLFIVGWGPDYGDPMTYAHTMVKGGDMADSLGIEAKRTLSEETEAKLATYKEMVDAANAIVSKTNEEKKQRYEAFADAEMYLLEELALLKPLYQRGQGYSCTVTKFIPYRSPRSGYGLSGDKLKGMEIINRPLSACERKVLKNEWDREKATAK